MSVWEAVDRLIDRSGGDLADLRSHRVHLLAARRWRARGETVPPDLEEEERVTAMRVLAAPFLLTRIRAAYDGPMLVLKGPEVAAAYPDPALRPFKDLDLLVPDAPAAQRALLASGFEPVGNPELYRDIHHERPLWLRGQPLMVEIHSAAKWPEGLTGPSTRELFDVAVPSAVDVDGVLALPRSHHAIVLTAHAWAHEPLRRALDLIDVAAMSDGTDGEELRALARSYGVGRAWRTTEAALAALLRDGPRTWPLRLWAGNLLELRERSVFEGHLARWIGEFWSLPARRALRRIGPTVVRELSPAEGESWAAKLERVRLTVRNAALGRSRHDAVKRAAAGRGRGE